MDRNPAPFAAAQGALALCLYMQRDYGRAATWIRRSDIQVNPIIHLIAASVYGQLGDPTAAERERSWLLDRAPDLLRNLRHELTMRDMKPDDQAHLVEGLRKAGFADLPF